jgi:hypothetical protein
VKQKPVTYPAKSDACILALLRLLLAVLGELFATELNAKGSPWLVSPAYMEREAKTVS